MYKLNFKIYKYRDHLWKNYMIYTPLDFQKKWSVIDSWRNKNSFNLEVTCFLEELIVEINKVSKELVLSLLKFSIKRKIKYLTCLCKQFITNESVINKHKYVNNVENIEFIISSCFSPPENTMLNSWYKSNHIENLDEIFLENIYYNGKNFNYSRQNTNIGTIHSVNFNKNNNDSKIEEDISDINNIDDIFLFDEDICKIPLQA